MILVINLKKKKSKKDLYFKRFEIIDFMENYEKYFQIIWNGLEFTF